MGFLDGYKEKITGVLGGLLLMLSSFGLTDWIAPLRPIHEAIKGGDWQAALAAFVGAILVWMRTFRRMRDDKAEGLS